MVQTIQKAPDGLHVFKTTKNSEGQRGIVLSFPQRISSADDLVFGVHVEVHLAGSPAAAESMLKQLRTFAITNPTSDRLTRVAQAGDLLASHLSRSGCEMFAVAVGCSLEVPPHAAGTEFTISEIDGQTASDRAVFIKRNGDQTALGCALGGQHDADGFPVVVTVCGDSMADSLAQAQQERDEPSSAWASGIGWRQNGDGPVTALGA